MRPPESIETARLRLRRPRLSDAQAIFARWAGDGEVTRYLSWPRHTSAEDTRDFLELAAEGDRAGTGFVLLVEARDDGRLLGSTGLIVEAPHRMATGYVLARDEWGKGFATEATRAVVSVAFADPRVVRVEAFCHVGHRASAHVLEKSGFAREGVLRRHTVFPNLDPDEPEDVLLFARTR